MSKPQCEYVDAFGVQCSMDEDHETRFTPDPDPELTRLLAEEDALEAAAEARKAEMNAQMADPARFGQMEWDRLTAAHGAQSDRIKERFMRLYLPGYNEKYRNDAAYWALNYVQAAESRSKLDKEIEALKLQVAELEVQVLKDKLWHAEDALEWIKDPYRYG